MSPQPHGTHITCYRLLLAAYQARERIRRRDAVAASNDAAIAAILCVTAVEAMLGELTQIAAVAQYHRYGTGSLLHEALLGFADDYENIVRSRERDQMKRLLSSATRGLCGQSADWGKSPFQDFDLLVTLRNSIIHGGLSNLVVIDEKGAPLPVRSKVLAELQRRGLVQRDRPCPEATQSSFEIAMTSELADWAVRTTREVMGIVMTPRYLSGAGMELQAVFSMHSRFPLVLAVNGISDVA